MRVTLPPEPDAPRLVSSIDGETLYYKDTEREGWRHLSTGYGLTWAMILDNHHADGVDVLDHLGQLVIAGHPDSDERILFRRVQVVRDSIYMGVDSRGVTYQSVPEELIDPNPHALICYSTMAKVLSGEASLTIGTTIRNLA